MARYSILLTTLILSICGLRSQTIVITFEGTVNGTPTSLDSILVMNLTQGGDTTIYFPDNELVLGSVGIADAGQADGLRMRSLANPFAGHTVVLLDATGGALLLLLTDAMGRELATYTANMASGAHRFRVGCDAPGVHMLTAVQGGVRRTLRLMATEGAGQVGLSYMGGGGRVEPRSDRALFTWTPGDELRYIGYATSGEVLYSAAIDEVPFASATRTFVMTAGATCPGSPTVTDVDGNTYPAVQIGDQCWMAENLRTGTYRDGTIIPNVAGNTAWTQLNSGAWSNYDNSAGNDATYGKLYNWYAAASPDLCPLGWHVPTNAEWTVLTDHLGGTDVAAGKMKAVSPLWNAPNTGATNESGFSGLPSGYRPSYDGYFYFLGFNGYWWSASESGVALAWSRSVNYSLASIYTGNLTKTNGFCVRCVRD